MQPPLSGRPGSEAPERLSSILVVDDSESSRAMLSSFLRDAGYQVATAGDGEDAVEMFRADQPDLVLMDVNMPRMDGLEATRRIRQLGGERWVPVIFVSSAADHADMVQGLAAGGDDYITKPVDLRLLAAKIRAMHRISALQTQLLEKSRELERQSFHLDEENRLAAHLYQRTIRHEPLADPHLSCHIRPASIFSGDVIVAARTPAGLLHVMLADAAGHGLSAAINVLPLLQIFYAMSDKGLPVAAIAAELNSKLRKLMPVDRFVATTLIEVDFERFRLRVWNGGNPALQVLGRDGKVVAQVESRHLALGLAPEAIFDDSVETVVVVPGCQLMAYSDGLPELRDVHGAAFGVDGIRAACAHTPPGERFRSVLAAAEHHCLDTKPHDDISLLMLHLSGPA